MEAQPETAKPPCRLKGTIYEADAHMLGWYRQPVTYKTERNGAAVVHRNGQRLGQYIVNMLLKDEYRWPELFYCESIEEAERMIRAEYGGYGGFQ